MNASTQQQRREVDRQVDALFANSASFHAMPAEERARIQRQTADIVEAMAHNRMNQAGGAARTGDPFAVPLEGGLPQPPGLPGQQGDTQPPQFTGGAQPGATASLMPQKAGDFGSGIAMGVQQAGEMLRQVNFPAFVAELIQGVFQAVVDASIQQMRAYGELVQSVAMSLSDFRDANVSENQARDHLVGKFPDLMQINITDEGPRVGVRPGADTDELPNISQSLGMDEEITDLDDELIEEKLVPAARNDLARSRQTLLATMLLMGINRIVVTDGKINAKMKFSFRARDVTQVHAQEYDYKNMGTTYAYQRDYETDRDSQWKGGEEEWSGSSKRWTTDRTQWSSTPAIYLTGVRDTQTAAELEANAKLSGEVSLNFRSETVDLNQLASQADIFSLERVRSAGRGAPGAPAPATAGPPPAGQPGNEPAQAPAP